MKRQHIVHSYGDEELVDSAELQAELEQRMIDDASTVPHDLPKSKAKPDNLHVTLSGRQCKCGSTSHLRVSSHECPLNNKRTSTPSS